MSGSGSTLGSHKDCLRLYCAREGLDPNAMGVLFPSGTVMVEDYLNAMGQDRDTAYGHSFDQEGSHGQQDQEMHEKDEVNGLLTAVPVPEPAPRTGSLVSLPMSSLSSLESSFVELEIKREIKIEEEEVQLWPEAPNAINRAVSPTPPPIRRPMPLPVPRTRFMPPGILPAAGSLGHLSGRPMVQPFHPMPLYASRPVPAPIPYPYPYPSIRHNGFHLVFPPPDFTQPPNPYAMAIGAVTPQAPDGPFSRPMPMPLESSGMQEVLSPASVPPLFTPDCDEAMGVANPIMVEDRDEFVPHYDFMNIVPPPVRVVVAKA
ncbi:unnamed protein product [Cyclocybe aegerita]|uniref:Uncharacterized protein n=1 Tax=Cyclocybe aegerita TaxID=1973307 RepID=A0A8S0WBU6_CYCAE|nr:unnamed protein product [Cyclocybe aegerita]